MDLKDLYQEIILDHGKNPRNLGKFENFNKTLKGIILCVEIKFMFTLKLMKIKKYQTLNLRVTGAQYRWRQLQ